MLKTDDVRMVKHMHDLQLSVLITLILKNLFYGNNFSCFSAFCLNKELIMKWLYAFHNQLGIEQFRKQKGGLFTWYTTPKEPVPTTCSAMYVTDCFTAHIIICWIVFFYLQTIIYIKNQSKITLTCLGRPLHPRIVVAITWPASLLELSVTSELDPISCKKKKKKRRRREERKKEIKPLHITKQSAELIHQFLLILWNRYGSISDNSMKQ
jgi:hypothetical protein